MLRIRLDINGRDIGEIGVWNRQDVDDEGRVRYSIYDLRGFTGNHIRDATHICDVYHDRSDGAAALASRVLGAVDEDRLGDV